MTFRYIDTHTHVNLSAFDADREEVLARAAGAEVAMINIGTKYSTSEKAVAIARGHSHAYAVVGLHPVQTVPGHHDEDEVGEGGKPFISKGEVFDYDAMKALASDPKVVAIGECGLDYFHTTPESESVQREAFIAQIHLANELRKPLVLHIRNGKDTTRNAYKDVADILKSEAKVRGNAHFFAGTIDDARLFLDMGFTISFTGVVTFSTDYNDVVRFAPADMIHAETDAPYVAPLMHRGKRNEPVYVIEIVRAMAHIRSEDEAIFRGQLLENAQRLYGMSL
jgi:TatD DNase family protein